MNIRVALGGLLALAILSIPIFYLIVNGKAYSQKPNQVAIRQPGKHLLGVPTDAAPQARQDLEFALLSQAAYEPLVDVCGQKTENLTDSQRMLEAMHWCPWTDFPEGKFKTAAADAHLRFQVWSNKSDRRVAVAFGGTDVHNMNDWLADLRWFIRRSKRKDEYTLIEKSMGESFEQKFLEKRAQPGWEFLKEATIFSTGHSLGGGLAQQFAYSLPPNPAVPRVTKVYAFDPSPVTGYYSVGEDLRDSNSEKLSIDRIYERGEILAIFRSIINFFYAPSACRPTIRQIRYNLFDAPVIFHNPFASHNMAEFASRMQKASESKPIDQGSLSIGTAAK